MNQKKRKSLGYISLQGANIQSCKGVGLNQYSIPRPLESRPDHVVDGEQKLQERSLVTSDLGR